VKKRTPEERLSRHLCPMGVHGSLRCDGSQLDGLYGFLGEGSEWNILRCEKCGFIAIGNGDKVVPVSSPDELERFTQALLALGKLYIEKIEKARRPICARYDKAAERLVSRILPPSTHTPSGKTHGIVTESHQES
jgi:hypothetical protein